MNEMAIGGMRHNINGRDIHWELNGGAKFEIMNPITNDDAEEVTAIGTFPQSIFQSILIQCWWWSW